MYLENYVNEVNEKLQTSVNNVKEWYDNNLLAVNATKSNILMITTKQREHFLSDKFTKLQNMDSCKYLGVQIDKYMSWNQQIDELSKDLNAKVWNLSCLRSFLLHNTLMDLYKRFIQPKIDHAITIWGYAN